MTISHEVLLLAVALGASALGGMLGMASGVFLVPILTSFCGVPIHDSIGASIVSVIACSCASAAPFLRAQLVNLRLALVLEVATTFGALIGVLLSGIVPIPFLYALFAAILLVSARQMGARREVVPVADPAARAGGLLATRRLDATYPDRATGQDVAYTIDRLGLGMGLMFGAGLVSALLGIGSGVLKIPAMDSALRLPIKVSSATSNFMIGVTAVASAGAYFVRGQISAPIAGPVALGSVVGAVLGARVLMVASGDKLRIFFIVVLLLLAVQMLLAAFGIDVSRIGG